MSIQNHKINTYPSYSSFDANLLRRIDQENSGRSRNIQEDSQINTNQEKTHASENFKEVHRGKNYPNSQLDTLSKLCQSRSVENNKKIDEKCNKLIPVPQQLIAQIKREFDLLYIKNIIRKYLQSKKNRGHSEPSHHSLPPAISPTTSNIDTINSEKNLHTSSWQLTEPNHSTSDQKKETPNLNNSKRKRKESINFISHTYPRKILPRPASSPNEPTSPSPDLVHKKLCIRNKEAIQTQHKLPNQIEKNARSNEIEGNE